MLDLSIIAFIFFFVYIVCCCFDSFLCLVLLLGDGLLQGVRNMSAVVFFQFCAIPAQLCSFLCFVGTFDLHSAVLTPLGTWNLVGLI